MTEKYDKTLIGSNVSATMFRSLPCLKVLVFFLKEQTGSALQRSRDTPSVTLTTSDAIRDDVSTISAADDNQVITINNLAFCSILLSAARRIENKLYNTF